MIEGPDSFHILKVENRRPAGPASFEEVQDKIKPMLENKKCQEEQTAFLNKIKHNALVDRLPRQERPRTSRDWHRTSESWLNDANRYSLIMLPATWRLPQSSDLCCA